MHSRTAPGIQPRIHLFAAAAAILLAACGKQEAPPQPPPPEVGVVTVRAQPVPLVREASARLAPTRASDVRARVAGVVQKRLYKEGSIVKEGDPLVQIDPAPYRAAYAQAAANLEQAEASARNAAVAANRNRELSKQNLVSRMQLDDAEALERTTAAQVSSARAQLQTARINLGYANITAPISGRAGRMRVLEGTLVGQGDATLITTVEQVDNLFVFFDQPAADFERLMRAQSSGAVTVAEGKQAELRIVLPDGTIYPNVGRLDFSDYTVNPVTGAVAFRGIVPNPDHALLPGMFVTVRLMAGTLNKGFRVPQLAVQRDGQGPFVFVVDAAGKVSQNRVDTVGTDGNDWVISSGLQDGDQVIVSGIQRAQPGGTVKATPAGEASAQPAQPAQAAPAAEAPAPETPSSGS
jgi:membrane fusion protein (multidrug efflux system)